MKLVLSVNNGFEQFASVVLHSFFQHHKEKATEIFILCEQLNESLSKLKWFEAKHSCFVSFHEVDTKLLDKCVVDGHVSLATYFRLLMAETLPAVDKVIYLDCDLVITGSLAELWNSPINEYAIAAVEDKNFDGHHKLGFPLGKRYFNAGVLLINLERWRRQNLTGEFLVFLEHNSDRTSFWDQDVLNMVLKDSCLFLDQKWNYIPSADKLTKDVRIIHFAGKHKPWDIHYPFPKIRTRFLKYCLGEPFPTTNYFQYLKAVARSLAV